MKEGQQEFEAACHQMGFETTESGGVIMAMVSRDQYNDSNTLKSIRKAAMASEYRGSYGIRMIQEGKTDGNL